MNRHNQAGFQEVIVEPGGGLPLEERLRGLVREWPELRAAVDMHLAAFFILKEARPIAVPVRLAADAAREKLSRGEYLICGIGLEFEKIAARDLMLRLAGGFTEVGLPGMSRILRALEEDRLLPDELLRFVAARDFPSVARRAEEQILAPALLWTLSEYAVRPSLRALREDLESLDWESAGWERPVCYFCGAPAFLGELQGHAQARRLRCRLCGAGWPVPRLGCVYCGCADRSRIGVFYPDGRGNRVRVEVCDACRGYLKVIVNFAPASPEELVVEDLSTLYLDSIAKQKGYRNPLVSL